MQRFLDIFFSGLALIVLSPLLVSVAIILKFSGEGEVFLRNNESDSMGKCLIYSNSLQCLRTAPT